MAGILTSLRNTVIAGFVLAIILLLLYLGTQGYSGYAFGFAIGVNNIFGADPPPCFTCGLNNIDPTTYDVPGRFFYARASLRM